MLGYTNRSGRRTDRGFRSRRTALPARELLARSVKVAVEQLETRRLLSFPPVPVVPSNGELQNLQQALKFAQKQQINAWDNHPIPYAVVGTNLTTGQVNVTKNPNSNSQIRIDVDSNPNTGQGGKDIAVSVSTELFLNGVLNPHLLATFDRLGSAPFAQNFEVEISFPFGAFAPEFFQAGTIQDPNLFIGYKTFNAAATSPSDPAGAGGIAPLKEEIRFIPNTMLGASHPLVQIQLATTGASNPLQFLTGYFDAAVGSGVAGIQNAGAYTAWTKAPPATVAIGVGVANSLIGNPSVNPFSGSINLDWTSSSRTKVVFDYREEEQGALADPDFDTTITFDQIANHETISLDINESTKTYSLLHNAHGQTTGKIEVLSERNDGLTIVGTATDVPTDVSLSVGLGGTTTGTVPAVTLDVTPLGAGAGAHDNNLDIKLEVMKTGGFLNTADFLGYNLGYVALTGSNLPDLTAGYLAASDSYGVKATNAGESIGYVELAVDDDGHYGAIIDGKVDINADGVANGSDDGVVDNRNVIDGLVDVDRDGDVDGDDDGTVAGIPVINGQFDVNHSGGVNASDDQSSFLVGLATPPHYYDGLPGNPGTLHHLFSLVDDGVHGTAVARIVAVAEASVNLNAASIDEVLNLKVTQAAPMTVYLRTLPTSNLISGHDVEVEADIENVPTGFTDFTIDPPNSLSYTTNPATGIASIHLFGHIDNTFFDIIAGNLPAVFSYTFDPDGSLSVTADDGDGVPEPASPGDQIGLLGVLLSNKVDPQGLSGASADLFGLPIRNAVFRVDQIPSFNATWVDDTGHTNVTFDTVEANAFLGGAQVEVRTDVDPILPLAHLGAPLAGTPHYLTFRDDGGTNRKSLAAGAFGIDKFSYDSNDANSTYAVSYSASGARPLVVEFDSEFGGKYFPQFDTDLTFTITNVPQSFDFVADLDPGFHYTASAAIASITLTGTIDDTDDAVVNGTDVNFSFINLPSIVRFSLEAGELKVIDGKLDINKDNAVNASDDGVAGGITVIDGKLDTNFDGAITASDDDTFLGATIIDGGIDVNLSGAVDGDDDGAVAGLELKMNGNISSINLVLSSENAILGTPYQLAQVNIVTVPAHTLAAWGGKRILVEGRDAGGSPLALGSVSALLSTDNDAADIATKLQPFTAGEGGARINYSPFLQTIDTRFNDAGSPSITAELDQIYNQAQVLNTGEDHLVGHVVGGTLDIASFQFTGFQELLIDPEKDGGTYEFRKPVAGISPFFVGVGVENIFAMLQIDNIPDLMRLVTNIGNKDITFHVEDDVPPPAGSLSHIGDIDIYVGEGTTAGDDKLAARVIMKDVPDDVHIFWDFGFPSGSANFDASNEFGLRFLAQDGSHRIVGGMELEDLQAGYNVAFNPHFTVGFTAYVVPTSLNLILLTATAGIDNDVNFDGGGAPIIGANGSKPGVDGFFTLYNMKSSPESLTDGDGNDIGAPAPGANEYVPGFSFLMKDFREFSLTLDAGVELFPAFLSPTIDLHGGPTLVGDFDFDFWAPEVDITADVLIEFGFFNRADYRDNTPIHIIPLGGIDFDNLHDAVYTLVGFHNFGDHVDPFA
jgi:hypothetical protein